MKFNQSGLLFVPREWQRVAVLRWLKRTHAWTGFWGALLFLMMGVSGFLLNHRDTLKIETGQPVEVSRMDVAVRPGQFADADAMGKWARHELGLNVEARAPRPAGPPGEGPPRDAASREERGARTFMGRPHDEAKAWTRVFTLVDGRVTASYVPGAANVTLTRDGQGVLSTIKNLHKGVGLNVAWVLFLDTIAGALLVMSLTGVLLWTRLHGSRLVAGGIIIVSLTWAVAAVWPYLS